MVRDLPHIIRRRPVGSGKIVRRQVVAGAARVGEANPPDQIGEGRLVAELEALIRDGDGPP